MSTREGSIKRARKDELAMCSTVRPRLCCGQIATPAPKAATQMAAARAYCLVELPAAYYLRPATSTTAACAGVHRQCWRGGLSFAPALAAAQTDPAACFGVTAAKEMAAARAYCLMGLQAAYYLRTTTSTTTACAGVHRLCRVEQTVDC